MLDVREIDVSYDGRAILRDVSLILRPGSIITLLGPNGAGKTTLIRALNGTVPVSNGTIELDGRPLKKYSRREIARKIAVVAQENETKFPVTVIEFVLSGRFARGSAFGWETEEDTDAGMEALDKCHLREYAHRLMNELSGGERQRVVLARAMAAESEILLLDEPTANLDLSHQALMFGLVREHCQGNGGCAVVITHDLNLASEFAAEVIMLAGGTIFAKGAPREILTTENIREVFGVQVMLDEHPSSKKLRVTAVY